MKRKIWNIPAWAWRKDLMVIRRWGEDWEFFHAWDAADFHNANAQAWEVNGEVVRVADLAKEEGR